MRDLRSPFYRLNKTQTNVFSLICLGCCNKTIAGILGILSEQIDALK